MKSLSHYTHYMGGLFIACCSQLASAQMLNISDTPLFLENSVQPNILFVMDDSGSMRWETTLNLGTTNPGGETSETLDFTPEDVESVLELCPGFNTLAYNPANSYTPWKGFNEDNQAYLSINGGLQGAEGNAATPMDNPWEGAEDDNMEDLSRHIYFQWNDLDNDNEFDNGECPTTVPATDDDAILDSCRGIRGCVVVASLSLEMQENYANWFTYYRKRTYIAQRATSELVYNSDARMGMGTLHNNDDVGRAIADMTEVSSKRSLLDGVSQLRPDGNTPLRRTLARAGNYFENGNGRIFDDNSDIGSPILSFDEGGACQQNFAVVFSDGYMNGDYSGVGNADGDDNTQYDGGGYGDSVSNRLSDIAMHYYERDLSPLANSVRESDLISNNDDIDGNMHQHLVTYTVAFGIAGNLTCNPLLESCTESWPTTINDNDRRSVDDMWHAAVNGRGQFLNAFDPAGLIESLEGAILSIEARTGSSASLAANSTTLNAETVVYQAAFNTGDWHGNVRAIPVSSGVGDPRAICDEVPEGNVCLGTSTSPGTSWETRDAVNTQNYDTDRVVVTFKPSTGEAVAFRWPNNIESPGADDIGSVITTNLMRYGPSNRDEQDSYGENIVNYLRGDRSNELLSDGSSPSSSEGFRRRENSILGDIISSAPKLVGPPSSRNSDPDYTTFRTTYADRQELLYVGANDGMLHAINTTNGEIEFSYIPNSSLFHLADLAQPNYKHRFYVDGSPTIGEAKLNGEWRTVLLGSHRAGGQGVFALDISDPSKFTERQSDIDDVFLWEFDNSEMGYSFSQPDIVQLADGEWYAIFGSGYNASEDDGDPAADGHSRLFIVSLEDGTANSIVVRDSSDSVDNPNGLSTATPVDENGDGITDFIYAGDLKGNLWRFDVRDTDAQQWSSANIFSTLSPEGRSQPITVRPSVAFHPDTARTGFLIYFGTGRYIDEDDSDPDNQDTQSFYAVWDDPTNPTVALRTPPTFNRISGYLQQNIEEEVTVNGNQLRITSDNVINWSLHRGWFIDLVNTDNNNSRHFGERVVSQSSIRGDRIVFVSILPDEIPCNFGGTSVLMELNYEDGAPLDDAPFDINGDGVINEADIIQIGSESIIASGIVLDGINTNPIFINGSDPETEHKMMSSSAQVVNSVTESKTGIQPSRRSSWRELNF